MPGNLNPGNHRTARVSSAGDAKLRTFSGRNNFRSRASRLDTNRFLEEQGLSSHVFITERDGSMTPKAFHALFGRIGARAKMQFPIHPHMLRHGCGYALANAGHWPVRVLSPVGRSLNASLTPTRAAFSPAPA